MPSIVPIITNAGLAAAVSASAAGLQATIAWVAIGDQGYVPGPTRTALAGERERVPVSGGIKTSLTQIHIDARFASAAEFWVREVGYFLSDGTLFALWSDPTNPIAYKPAMGELVLSLDLSVAATPTGSVTIAVGEGLAAALSGELADAVAKLKRAATAAGTTYPPGDDDAVRRTVQALIDQSAALVGVSNAFTGDQNIYSTDDSGSVEAPGINLRRQSATPAANDTLGAVRIQGHNSAATLLTYGKTSARIVDPTAGAESGELLLVTRKNGALQNAVTVGQGMRIGTPTGGDKGVGTLNASELWENGKRLDGRGMAKAWVQFDGQGTVAIRGFFNVASITDIGPGQFEVNFATPMDDANYAVLCMTMWDPGVNGIFLAVENIGQTASKTGKIVMLRPNGAFFDPAMVSVAIFR